MNEVERHVELLRGEITYHVPDGFRDEEGIWHETHRQSECLLSLGRISAEANRAVLLEAALRIVRGYLEQGRRGLEVKGSQVDVDLALINRALNGGEKTT